MQARISVQDHHIFGSGSAHVRLEAWVGGKWKRVKGNPETKTSTNNGFVGVDDAVVELYPKTKVRYVRSFYPGGKHSFQGTWKELLEQKDFPLVHKLKR